MQQQAVISESLHKNFGSGDHTVKVLRGVDFSVNYGEMTFLVGPSGCCKTTLLDSRICHFADRISHMNDGLITQVETKQFRPISDAWRVQPGVKAVASVRGNTATRYPLEYVRLEPYVVPKRNLTGDATERVDTRVLQAIYRLPVGVTLHPGQQMDLSIETEQGGR